MPTLRNINPLGDVNVAHPVAQFVPAGATFDVPDDIAGRAPSTSKDKDGNDVVDPGEGLLAQVGNYELVAAKAPKGGE